MSKIREIFTKLFKREEGLQHPKLTPNEVELNSFKERERLDGVKKELAEYRYKDNQEVLIGTPLEKGRYLHSPYIFKSTGVKPKGLKEVKPKEQKNVFIN